MTQPVAKLINNGNFYVQGQFDEASLDLASGYQKNLIPYSQQFNNPASPWYYGSGVLFPSVVGAAPDGSNTATLMTEDTKINTSHWYAITVSSYCVPYTPYTLSCYFKPASGDRNFFLQFYDGIGYAQIQSNTTGGIYSAPSVSGYYTNPTGGIVAVGNGWFRMSITCTVGPNPIVSARIALFNNGAQYYNGNGTSCMWIWGPQAEAGSRATEYEPTGSTGFVAVPPGFTTRTDPTGFYTIGSLDEVSINPTASTKTNLIASSVFLANAKVTDSSYWNLGYSALAPELDTIAPDGTNTALTLLETNTASNYPVIQTGTSTTYGNTLVMTVGKWYTASVYFSRPGLTPSLGANPSYIALVMNSTNAFGGADLFRNQLEYPSSNAQGVPQTLTAITNTNTNGGSLKFTGSGNLTSTGTGIMAFGTGNFTIEYYMWKSGYSYGPVVFDSRTNAASSTGINDQWYGSNYIVQVGGTTLFTSTAVLNIYGNWNHIAIVRSGTGTNQTAVYINGVLNGTFTCATNLTDPNLVIGNRVDNQLNLSGANLTNFRVTKGVALYSGNFTMPTAPPTASANTSLLLNVLQPSSFTADSSANNYTLINNGVTYSSYNPNYNGWYRLAMPFQATTQYENFGIWANGFGGPPSDGNVLLVWGPQIESGNVATSYIPTINSQPVTGYVQRTDNTGLHRIAGAYDEVSYNPTSGYTKNLVSNSATFSDWVTNISYLTAAPTVQAPDGTYTAYKLTDTADSATTFHSLRFSPSSAYTNYQTYTFSIYVKSAELASIAVYQNGSSRGARFNLANQTSSDDTGVTHNIIPLPNGWLRVSNTLTVPAGATYISLYLTNPSGSTSYIGTGGSGVYIWGPQLEFGPTATEYVPTGANGIPLT